MRRDVYIPFCTTPADAAALQEIARRNDVPRSHIVRQAIRLYLSAINEQQKSTTVKVSQAETVGAFINPN